MKIATSTAIVISSAVLSLAILSHGYLCRQRYHIAAASVYQSNHGIQAFPVVVDTQTGRCRAFADFNFYKMVDTQNSLQWVYLDTGKP